MTYTQADIDYYHDLVDQRDAMIEHLESRVSELCDALSLYHNLGLSDCDESCKYLKLIQDARKEIE